MAQAEPAVIEMIRRLVGFDTTSAKSNLALIDWVADHLAGHGIESRLVRSPDGQKANLFATVGPAADGGIVLSGHSDVVPVDGQPWDTDPFALAEKDGRLYGRGTADMKSFIAIALALVPEMKAAGLRAPLHIALTYDEEVGCFGAPGMIAELGRSLPRPAAVFVGEPTEMRVVNAHKGPFAYETVVTGLEAHSSAPHSACNAIHYGGRIVVFLEGLAAELRGRRGPDAHHFEPPYTTLSVTRIEGGTAHNIIPRQCRLTWDVRLMPGEDPDEIPRRLAAFVEAEILPAMQAEHPQAAVATKCLFGVPPLQPEAEAVAERLAKHLLGTNETIAIAFGTEGGQYQEHGLSAVICGPGSIAQAHKPNEFIALSEVAAGTAFVRRLIAWAAENGPIGARGKGS